ncbi:MAG: hypothetical protein L0Y44_07040 [Phycisphaerales bacterium]|nr:hypothetical protein [Phycisphaerales bacterium]MCI0630396.1 hypothetical protein [Phycisphaerales bacterium]MCI0675830.1 hypothetical protein [Phycisphaerales bacterium]
MTTESVHSESAAAAAVLAAGIGCAAMGFVTTLAAASTTIKSWLDWGDPAGSLTGKTTLAVAVWLVSWVVLQGAWRSRAVRINSIWFFAMFLVVAGLIGTFPPFFEFFAHD